MRTATNSRSERIARLNDRARQAMGLACVAVATEGFRSLPEGEQSRVRELVETYDAFTPDNDPYGEPISERSIGMRMVAGAPATRCRASPPKKCSGRSTPMTAPYGLAARTRPIPL